MANNPKITFFGGVGSVTGANFMIDFSGEIFLVDCGLMQGEEAASEENRKDFPFDVSTIKALFVTHAHLDHVGRIPKLVRDGYKGPIYSTVETKGLAELVLTDAAGILANEAKQRGESPIYVADDVQKVFPLWKTVSYHETLNLSDNVSVSFKDAGHILGSSMIEFSWKGKEPVKILFSGDLGNSPAPLLKDTETLGDADYLVIESAYGDRNHEGREERRSKLENVVKDTIARGGTLVIPAFAVDRTQILLYELNNMVEKGSIPSVPVFVDSPMATKATEIYKSGTSLFNDDVREQIGRGDDIFSFNHLKYTVLGSESRDIWNINGPKIILAGSGMSIGGRVISHEEKFLSDQKNTILLVGYQTPGSIGRQLADGHTKVRIHGETIKVKARVEKLYGYSAHRDSDHLLEFVSTGTDRLKQVFVVMGEPKASMHLAQRINDELGIKAIVPERGKGYEIYE